jgi:hypothetical protein
MVYEVAPVLHWIVDLGERGLTTMMVVEDFFDVDSPRSSRDPNSLGVTQENMM